MKRHRIAVIAYSGYPSDVRVRREVEACLTAGFSVDVICYRKVGQSSKANVNGARIYRVNTMKKRGGKLRYIWEYTWFTFHSFILLSKLFVFRHYTVIHVHNMPDTLVFSAIIPKIFGSRILLDLHDPSPEVFMTKYNIEEKHSIIRLLKSLEKFCIYFADYVITPNKAFRELFIHRGCPSNKISIVMNIPMEKLFISKRPLTKTENGSFTIMYHGTMVKRNGLLVALKAISILRYKLENVFLKVYGSGDFLDSFLNEIEERNLSENVKYYGYLSNDKLADIIYSIDIGIVPNELTPFTELNLPVRIFEYLALNKPVIVPKTTGICDYFTEKQIIYFKPGDYEDLADKLLKYYHSKDSMQPILSAGKKVYEKHNWDIQQKIFLSCIDEMAK